MTDEKNETKPLGNPRRWEYGSGELMVEAPDGTIYRIGDIPEEYRSRHKPLPNEVVIRTDEDLEKVIESRAYRVLDVSVAPDKKVRMAGSRNSTLGPKVGSSRKRR